MRVSSATALLFNAATALLWPSSSTAQTQDPADGIESLVKISDQALTRSRAFSYLEELTDSIGPRLTGSPEAAIASEWARRQLQSIGLVNVHLEHWQIQRAWRRGRASAELVSPYHLQLNIASLGWVGSTKKGGVEAEVILVDSDGLEDEVRKNGSRWPGKILFLVPKGVRRSGDIGSSAQLGPFLRQAHAASAAAVISEDERPGMMLPHTGPAVFAESFFPIPVVVMAREHRTQVSRLLKAGKRVRIRLDVDNQISVGPARSSNVVGEIRGNEHPEQVVILGAHLDSWDLGTGAVDDGFGVASVLGAAEAIVRAGAIPRRTIRVVLFTGEEQGLLGSRAYVRSHQTELPDFVCSLVLDWGRGSVVGMSVGGHEELIAPLEHFAKVASGLETMKISRWYMQFTDSYAFTLAGVPGIAFAQESRDYAMLAHSAADTLDQIEPDVLVRTSALAAKTAFWIANHPTRLGIVWSPSMTAQKLSNDKQQTMLELFGLWPFTPQ